MKVELNEVLIEKNYINEFTSYNIRKYIVVSKYLSNDSNKNIYEIVELVSEDDFNDKFINSNSDLDDLYKSRYSLVDLDKRFVKSEEEYKEYFNNELNNLINRKLEEIEKLKIKVEEMKELVK